MKIEEGKCVHLKVVEESPETGQKNLTLSLAGFQKDKALDATIEEF